MPTTLRRQHRTQDRAPPGTRTAYHTVGQIGPKRRIRSDGSLLCEDVAIARTGPHLYAPGEVPIPPPTRPNAAQVIHITRDAEALFAPCSLGSAVGAAVTDNHPPTDVTPENRAHLSKGFILDAWRGEGMESDLMMADLVVYDKGMIHKINTGQIREVSLGYTAQYERTGDGEGRQRDIVVNHLALVERGRCGQRCAIGDRQPDEEVMPRSTAGNGGSRPRVRLQEAAANMQEVLKTITEGAEDEDEDGVHVHVHMGDTPPTGRTTDGDPDGGEPTLDAAVEERFVLVESGMLEMKGMLETVLAKLEGKTTDSDPSKDEPPGDSTALATSFQQFTAQAEVLIPGFKSPTFDAALPRAKTVDAMCSSRRNVLTLLAATKDGEALIGQVAEDGFNVATADCAAVATVFKSAAAVRAASNNRGMTGDRMGIPAAGLSVMHAAGAPKVPTADEINAANAKYWEGRNAAS